MPAGRFYRFVTLDNANGLTFNQLLGINNHGVIAGWVRRPGPPEQGYLLFPPYGQGSYRNENFPGSGAEVTRPNNSGVTVGFWSSMNNANMVNDNFGFVDVGGHFRNADFPTGSPAAPPVDQLLGVNDQDIAVGFYTDADGNNHGYEYNIREGRFSTVTESGVTSLTAAAINNLDQVAGFYTNPATGNTDGFLKANGRFTDLAVPGASATMATGLNIRDEVVGVYTVGSGSSATMYGFTWTPQHGFSTVDDPHGIGTTTVNGVNDFGQLVGFCRRQQQHRHFPPPATVTRMSRRPRAKWPEPGSERGGGSVEGSGRRAEPHDVPGDRGRRGWAGSRAAARPARRG
jgi:hypothetical protein